MKFQYTKFKMPDGGATYRPILPILFKNKEQFVYVEAVIDSGADHTILPIELAGELGIKLDEKSKQKFFGAGNNSFHVYPSPRKIEHVLRQNGFRTIRWESKVYFAEAQPSILLGFNGFLDRFKVSLNGPKKEFDITE